MMAATEAAQLHCSTCREPYTEDHPHWQDRDGELTHMQASGWPGGIGYGPMEVCGVGVRAQPTQRGHQ